MQKLTITTKTADFKAGKFIDETITAVVASTKSQNNLLEELAKAGKIVGTTTVKDFYLDKEKVKTVIENTVNEQLAKETDETKKATVAHIMDSLNRHCIFYNPINRKKQ